MSKQNKSLPEPEMASTPIAAPVSQNIRPPDEDDPTRHMRHFFRPEDWVAAVATFLFSSLVFFRHMSPEVTLQDSGELVTGAFTFGVPHPPGYPLWAFLGYIWSHYIVPFGNPAWRIGLMSVVTGGLVVGVMTLMMTRSIRVLLHSLPWSSQVNEKLQHWIAITIGISSALLFGFNRGVWLWASVSEMRVMNVFSFVLTGCLFFGWMIQPQRRFFLYATWLTYALSVANHQTIMVMAAPLMFGTLVVGLDQFVKELKGKNRDTSKGWFALLMPSLSVTWELGVAVLLGAGVGLLVLAWFQGAGTGTIMIENPLVWAGLFFAAGLAILAAFQSCGWLNWRRAIFCAVLLLLGCGFYFYMPLAASTNPPMNWGYTATREGFLHHISRGQYEKLQAADFFTRMFWIKITVFLKGLSGQYSLPLTLVGLGSLILLPFCWLRLVPRGRSWLLFVWAAFAITSLGLLTIINPKLEKQEQEIVIKFFAPAHGFYAMLIGYGLAIIISLAAWKLPGAGFRYLLGLVCVGLLALPLITYQRNWALCSLRGHDFGYLFGYYMFKPGGGYPDMEKDAVLYGGTDPGRFVPTYLIFCESRVPPKDRYFDRDFDRSDVYIITQNALADTTYMNYIRDHYDFSRPKNDTFLQRLFNRAQTYPKEPIHIPSTEDSNTAFRQYIDDVQAGRIAAGAEIQTDSSGRVSVQGAAGVMAINGILAKWIFDRNKDKHAFYVEESYVIPWMYGYLRPAGVIMKIEKEPVPSPQQDPALWQGIVAKDKAYWADLTARLLARPEFGRDSDARKTFSKLRSAIGGLYMARGLTAEAEQAFREAIVLCPESPEAVFRYADLCVQQRRHPEAKRIVEEYRKIDPFNAGAQAFMDNMNRLEGLDSRRTNLETQFSQKGADLNGAMELASIYQQLNMLPQFHGIVGNILSVSNLPPNAYMGLAHLFGNVRQWDRAGEMIDRYLATDPKNFRVWTDLAFIRLSAGHPETALSALKHAIEIGGDEARAALQIDTRFAPLQENPAFRSLLMGPAAKPMRLPNSLGL